MVQPVLSTVDGVASATILGGQTFAMRVWLDPVKMAGRNISANEVSAAIAANNFQAAAGQAKGFFIVSNVQTNTDLRNVDQFKKMIVKAKDGGFVRMEDIATVELAAQSSDASVAFNGEHAIFIGVEATPQGNPLTIVRGVRALMPELERNLPPSLKMKVAYDSTKFIQSSIDEVKMTLIEAVGIVVVVIFLFLGLVPLGHHSRRHHPAVADRRLHLDAGGRLQLQPADAARHGARHRPRGRRRHRGGGEHPPPSRRG